METEAYSVVTKYARTGWRGTSRNLENGSLATFCAKDCRNTCKLLPVVNILGNITYSQGTAASLLQRLTLCYDSQNLQAQSTKV